MLLPPSYNINTVRYVLTFCPTMSSTSKAISSLKVIRGPRGDRVNKHIAERHAGFHVLKRFLTLCIYINLHLDRKTHEREKITVHTILMHVCCCYYDGTLVQAQEQFMLWLPLRSRLLDPGFVLSFPALKVTTTTEMSSMLFA